jgi:hypothetical protein
MLDWLVQHFIGQPVGGQVAAAFAGVPEARDAYYAWETAHPGEASFSYPAQTTDWDLYPYLVPAVTYLSAASYQSARPPVGTVRWHALTASASAGGPYTLYVAYATDGIPATIDLSASLGTGQIAAVSPMTGTARAYPTNAVRVATIGTLLAPTDKVIVFPGTGDFDEDGDVDLNDFAQFAPCLTGPGGGPIPAGCGAFDSEPDNDVDMHDVAPFQESFNGSL